MDRTIMNAFALIHGSLEPIIYGLAIIIIIDMGHRK